MSLSRRWQPAAPKPWRRRGEGGRLSLERRQVFRRQRDGAERGSLRSAAPCPVASRRGILAVKIGSAADERAQTHGEAPVGDDVLGRVIGVVDLDRIEALLDERSDQLIAPGHAGMRERRDAAGAVNRLDHVDRSRPRPRHEGGTSGRQPSIECVLHRRHVTGSHQRARDLRPAHRRSGTRGGREQHALDVDRHVERCEGGGDLAHAQHPKRALTAAAAPRAARSPDRRNSRACGRRGPDRSR